MVRVTRWFAEPGNVAAAFWPAVVVVTWAAGPSMVVEAVASGATESTSTVNVPVFVPPTSMKAV